MNTSPLLDLWTRLWPDYQPTRLLEVPALARLTGVGRVFVKVEADRPLGSFKSLGGMIASCARAGERNRTSTQPDLRQ